MSKISLQTKKTAALGKTKLFFLLFLWLLPMYLPLKSLVAGAIPHWYDTAWGLLIGLENHEKLSLIGYAGGIPGVHYGPHWFWMLSLVQYLSKNPVVIAAIVLFLPYFTVFPYLFYRFGRRLGLMTMALLWINYMLAYGANTVHLWHVHLSPIIFFALIYILTTVDFKKLEQTNIFKFFLGGFLTSFLINIHWSFGVATSFGVVLFLLISFLIKILKSTSPLRHSTELSRSPVLRTRKILAGRTAGLLFASFVAGSLLSHLPFILFELRHDFYQTKNIITVVTNSLLYNSAVVGQVGLSKNQIVGQFLHLPVELLQIPPQLFHSFWSVVTVIGIVFLIKKPALTAYEKRLVAILFFCVVFLTLVYFSSRNPIWVYHFIGGEIIFLLLIAILAHKSRLFFGLLFLWTLWLIVNTTVKTVTGKRIDPLSLPTLSTKRHIVESIYADAQNTPFTVFAYSPAINTYDYDYLFKWLGNDKFSYAPQPQSETTTTYLIIPPTDTGVFEDFINYKTPHSGYVTAKEWQIADGTRVVKRMKIRP